MEKEARDRAYKSLGIDAQQRELEAIQKQKEELEQRERRLAPSRQAIVNGTSVEDELDCGTYYHNSDGGQRGEYPGEGAGSRHPG